MEPTIAKLAVEYMEEDGIVFEQGVKTSEVKMTVMALSRCYRQRRVPFDALPMRQDASLISNPLHLKIMDIAFD